MTSLEEELALGDVPRRAVRGGASVGVLKLIDQVLQLGARLLVARAVGPEEYGAVGVALLVLALLESLSESGLRAALVERESVDQTHVNTVWAFGLLRGLVVSGAVVLLSSPIAAFFDSPESAYLLQVFAVAIFLRAATSPALQILERHVRFDVVARLGLVRALVMFIVTAAITFAHPTPVALVVGVVAGELVTFVGSFVLAESMPRPRIDRGAFRELARYGRWVAGSSIAVVILVNLDDIVVARIEGSEQLAIYQMAFLIASLPTGQVSMVLNRVTFSSFARLRSRQTSLAHAFLRVYSLVAAALLPIAALLIVNAHDLLVTCLGAEWGSAATPLAILAIAGALRGLGAVTTPLLRAAGYAQTVAAVHWAMVAALAIVIVPVVRSEGIEGAAWSVVAVNAGLHWFRYRQIARAIDQPVGAILACLRVPLILALAAGGGALAVQVVAAEADWEHALASLLISTTVGVVFCLAALALLHRMRRTQLVDIARTYFRHLTPGAAA